MPPAAGQAGFVGAHDARLTRLNGTSVAVACRPILMTALATTPVYRWPPAYVIVFGWDVTVTPAPGDVSTAGAKIRSPVEPVSINSGTGFERPTRTRTIGCAPMAVPWPPSIVTGMATGRRASACADAPSATAMPISAAARR